MAFSLLIIATYKQPDYVKCACVRWSSQRCAHLQSWQRVFKMRRMAVPLLMTTTLANRVRQRAFKRVHRSCDAAHQASFFCSVVIVVRKAPSGSTTNKKPKHLNSGVKLHARRPVIFIGRGQAEPSVVCVCALCSRSRV